MPWPTEPPPACADAAAVQRVAPVSGYYPIQHASDYDGRWIVAELLVWEGGRIWSAPGVEDHIYDHDLAGARIGPRVALPDPSGPTPASGKILFALD